MEISIDDFSFSRSSTKTLQKSIPKAPIFFLVMLILFKFSKKIYPTFLSIIFKKLKCYNDCFKKPLDIPAIAPELIKKKVEFDRIMIIIKNKQNAIFHQGLKRINNLFEEEIFMERETFVQQIQNKSSTINIAKKLKHYVFCIFGIKLIEALDKLRIVLKEKYLEKFNKKYPETILDAPQILDFVSNEFFETLFNQGLNCVIDYIQKIFDSYKFELNEKLSLQKIFLHLDQIQNDLLASQSEFNTQIRNANFNFTISFFFYFIFIIFMYTFFRYEEKSI